jgi:hypothetical protein
MIFCSRRVFLNVVTQLLDLNTLLNANYFLADMIRPTGYAGIIDEPKLGTDGEITFQPSLDFTPETTGIHNYFINYSRIFDVSPYIGALAAGSVNNFASPQERLIAHLNDTNAQIAIYQELFQKKLHGNGLQIVMLKDDRGVQMCGHIICSFLAEVFGADVTFIDPQYRPKTKGQLNYAGNKKFAKEHVMRIRDAIFCSSIQNCIDAAGYGNGETNLMAFFDNADLTIEDMFHAYYLLFPNDQLPAGNYTIPHMKQLIIGRLMDACHRGHERTTLSNMGIDLYNFDHMFDEYKVPIEEDFSEIT